MLAWGRATAAALAGAPGRPGPSQRSRQISGPAQSHIYPPGWRAGVETGGGVCGGTSTPLVRVVSKPRPPDHADTSSLSITSCRTQRRSQSAAAGVACRVSRPAAHVEHLLWQRCGACRLSPARDEPKPPSRPPTSRCPVTAPPHSPYAAAQRYWCCRCGPRRRARAPDRGKEHRAEQSPPSTCHMSGRPLSHRVGSRRGRDGARGERSGSAPHREVRMCVFVRAATIRNLCHAAKAQAEAEDHRPPAVGEEGRGEEGGRGFAHPTSGPAGRTSPPPAQAETRSRGRPTTA
jgi:hypothetical protein